MEYTEKKIKALSNKELQYLEHDNSVDCINDLSGSLHFFKIYNWVKAEMKKRNLKKLPKLNGFN
jgi:hypothetical protein